MNLAECATWAPPPHNIPLPAAEAHVFRLSLDVSTAALRTQERFLSADERVRASQFVFDADRSRYIAARSTLRAILGHYLDTPPEAIGFRYGPFGKPELDEGCPLRFNLSHSADLALVAVAWRRAVGVDLERIVPKRACEEVAARLFSPTEVSALARLAPAERLLGFFRCWTRKEAYVKARGDGFCMPLPSFNVSLKCGDLPCLLDMRQCTGDTSLWTLANLEAGPGFAASIVIEGAAVEIRQFDWPLVLP
jgi:4'-phosphopantetheinyl transferase